MPAKKLNELIKKLEEDKVPEKEIEQVIELIAQLTTDKYLAEAFANFTKEEIEEINRAENQKQADVKIKLLFYEKTGKSTGQLRDEILDYYSQAVLDKYLEKKSLPQNPQEVKGQTLLTAACTIRRGEMVPGGLELLKTGF